MSQDTTESKSSAVESISALEFMTALLADHKIMQIDEIGSGEKEDSWKQCSSYSTSVYLMHDEWHVESGTSIGNIQDTTVCVQNRT